MSDKMTMLLLLLVVAGLGAAAIYYFVLPRGDVRKIDPAHQDRFKIGSKQATASPTVAKTAQLSALRDRLADAQPATMAVARKLAVKPSETAKAASVEKPWRPEDAGLADSHTPETMARAFIAPVAEPIRPVAKPMVVAPPVAPLVPQIIQPSGSGAGTVAPVAAAVVKVQVLLVDDSKVVRVKTEKLLLNKGYAVTTAVDGIDALAKLETLKPAIIITDIEMPNLDGFGLVRNVRGNLRTAEIPVIVMTSHVNLHLDIAATEGINGFLPKPFNDQDLLDQVAFLCES